jgi:hypothetical protein
MFEGTTREPVLAGTPAAGRERARRRLNLTTRLGVAAGDGAPARAVAPPDAANPAGAG